MIEKIAIKVGGESIQAPKGVPTGDIKSLTNIIQTFIALLFLIAIIVALFLLIYSGFMWITSVGDKQKLQQARQRLTYVIVGLVIVFTSLILINLIGNFFGIENVLSLPGV